MNPHLYIVFFKRRTPLECGILLKVSPHKETYTISTTAYLINILMTYVCKQEVQNLNNFQHDIPNEQLNAENPLTN